MGRARIWCSCCCTLLILILLACNLSQGLGKEECKNSSSCGDITDIRYPFRLKDHPKVCGDPMFNLTCERNRTVLHLNSQKYYVKSISYPDEKLVVLHSALVEREQYFCSYLPPDRELWFRRYKRAYLDNPFEIKRAHLDNPFEIEDIYNSVIAFIKCRHPVWNVPSYIDATPCFFKENNASSVAYAFVGRPKVSDLQKGCKAINVIPIRSDKVGNARNYSEIRSLMLMGFNLSWKSHLGCIRCSEKWGSCYIRWSDGYTCYPVIPDSCNFLRCQLHIIFNEEFKSYILDFRDSLPDRKDVWPWLVYLVRGLVYLVLLIEERAIVGILLLIAFVVYKHRTRHIWMDTTIEDFLSKYRTRTPTRYSYSHIKKMTNGFKTKLGEGGYGSVFKGKLTNGHPIAVKMLGTSKGNGQDFINEVSTIGRIHHVNVVRLLGFCSEGSKRALIYDFMPNGSLDKYIFSQEDQPSPLSWEKIHDIALGIARGIEYLHRGCDMRILHFDIKPHNILLDKDFTPKVSDFGLAKLYSNNDSIVSVTAARGTIGYIAPELFYRNLGGVSYKSDVYSFGMMLLEMAGRRRNLNAFAENSSQIYFPSWIYDRLDQGGDLELVENNATEGEKEVAKKLIIIGLWCIQLRPEDRPSMSRVVEMLEGSHEALQMPPKPVLSSPQGVDESKSEIQEINITL